MQVFTLMTFFDVLIKKWSVVDILETLIFLHSHPTIKIYFHLYILTLFWSKLLQKKWKQSLIVIWKFFLELRGRRKFGHIWKNEANALHGKNVSNSSPNFLDDKLWLFQVDFVNFFRFLSGKMNSERSGTYILLILIDFDPRKL